MPKVFPASTPFLLAAALILAPQVAGADTPAEPIRLDTLVVTAAGVAVDPLTAPASVTVVTGEQLEKSRFVDLTDALDGVPGVAVAGAADGENIFIRGLPAEYTLILIDGKRVNTRQSRTNAVGGVDQFFVPPASAIDRIEIVRGPMSSLFGSDAMGGVINIITKPVAPVWTGSVSADGALPQASEDSAEGQAAFYLSGPILGETLGVQFWGRYFRREESGRERGPGEREVADVTGRLIFVPMPGQEMSVELGRTDIDTDPRLDSRLTAALGYEGTLLDWDADASFSYEVADRETDGSDRNPEIANAVLDAKASRGFELMGAHSLTLGGQFTRSELTDFNPGLRTETDETFSNRQWALFLEDIWQVHPRVSLTLGSRYTHDQRFGGKVTPRVYGLLQLTDDLYLSAGAASGYRTPELRQSVEGYFLTTNRGAAVIEGNPDLEPEESTSYEIGLRHDDGRTRFAVTGFHTDFTNRIDTRDTGDRITLNGRTFDLFEYFNVGKARIRGVELSAGHFLTPALELSGSYTYTDSETLTGDLKGLPLARTPDHQASLRVDWATPLDGLGLWAAGRYFGDNVSISSTSRGSVATENDGYATVDIGAVYALNDTLTLRTTVFNVSDARIDDEDNGTVLSGRTFWLGIAAEF